MKHNYYNQYFDLGQQQIVNFNLYQIGLPEKASYPACHLTYYLLMTISN